MGSHVLSEVSSEIHRAVGKFPTWPDDPFHALSIVGEEYGELSKAVLQHAYEPEKASLKDIREEAVQTAAMAIRFVESLDSYDFSRSSQHSQIS